MAKKKKPPEQEAPPVETQMSVTPTQEKMDKATAILGVMSEEVLMSPLEIKKAAGLPVNQGIFSVLTRLAKQGKVVSPTEGKWRLAKEGEGPQTYSIMGPPAPAIPKPTPAPKPAPAPAPKPAPTPTPSAKKRKSKKQSSRPHRG